MEIYGRWLLRGAPKHMYAKAATGSACYSGKVCQYLVRSVLRSADEQKW